MTCAIFINSTAMALPYFGASEDFVAMLEAINTTCGALFITEAVLKIVSFRAAYFHGACVPHKIVRLL